MNKKLLMMICEGDYDRAEKNIDNQIEKLQKMKLLSKVVHFVNRFSQHLAGDDLFGDLSEHYGKKLKMSFGYDKTRLPVSSSVFYTFDGAKGSFSIEDGSQFLELLQLSDQPRSKMEREFVIDHAFEPRLIALIMGEEVMTKYMDTCLEMRVMA